MMCLYCVAFVYRTNKLSLPKHLESNLTNHMKNIRNKKKDNRKFDV